MGNYNKRGRTQDKLKDISGCMEQGMGTKNRGQVTLFLLDLSMRGGAKTTSWPWQKVGPDTSMKKTDAWILGSTRNPEMYILKDKETQCHQRYLDLMLNLKMALCGVWQLKKLVVSYCDWGNEH
ncbi:hypothetical protein V6N13_083373 [Hibiscus sabdariffa]|uniref:Uncharacterized protein n=1 Tax=Hibiscus sabdariffa TaxID=183260 RepID=A0ABR2SY43_9ROSI